EFVRGKPTLADHGLEPLTAEYGIHFGDRVVLDPHQVPGGSELLAFTVTDGWADHPAVRSLVLQPAAFFEARELWTDGGGVTLVSTSEQGWAEADLMAFQAGGVLGFDEDADRRGPIPVVAAGERGD